MKTLLLILIAFSVFTGMIMELYKKKIRKDKADEHEISMVAWAISVLFGIVTFIITDEQVLPDGVQHTPLLVLLLSVLIYLFQLPACQAVWKPVLKKWIERKAHD